MNTIKIKGFYIIDKIENFKLIQMIKKRLNTPKDKYLDGSSVLKKLNLLLDKKLTNTSNKK